MTIQRFIKNENYFSFFFRGKESATMLKPRYQDLRMLGLGSSVGTPPEGITAPIVLVSSFDELQNITEQVI